MRRKCGVLAAGLGLICLVAPVAAHHSFGWENPKKPVRDRNRLESIIIPHAGAWTSRMPKGDDLEPS
jgi:hypothetical protein